MPDDNDMTKCDVKRLYKSNETKDMKWVQRPVAEVQEGERVRCTHCHGKVRVHRQHVSHGPQDHVEHTSREDSENCRGGHHFKGTHKRSGHPID